LSSAAYSSFKLRAGLVKAALSVWDAIVRSPTITTRKTPLLKIAILSLLVNSCDMYDSSEAEKSFKNHKLSLRENEVLYLFSEVYCGIAWHA